MENSEIGLEGARNATLPEVDLVGIMQNNGLAGPLNPLRADRQRAALAAATAARSDQILARNYPTYGIGVQVTLPIHNRIAEADLARDEMQVKQSQVRLRAIAEPGAPGSGGRADRHAPRARVLRSGRAGAQVPAGIARSRAGQVRSGSLHQRSS